MPNSLIGWRHSLRIRLAALFALFGMLVSVLLSAALFVAAQHTSDRLMDETLRSELDDYLSRRARNPASPPPVTLNIRGYVIEPGSVNADVPRPVVDLPPGKHQLSIDGVPYRVGAIEERGVRYVMMFDESRQRQREERFFLFLVLGTLAMALVSAGLGWWLAGRVVAPMAELARLISAHREHPGTTVEFSDDEFGKLASGVFGEYVSRMHAFISREQAFTTDVSHELRTPLSIVRGVVELMEDDEGLAGMQRDRVERIRRAVNGMSDVTSALLMMAREGSPREPVGVPCDVCDVVREVVEGHRHLVAPTMVVKFECREHPRLLAEATLLKIVVGNLVLNAFTHADAGTVTILVDREGMTVSDTGRGILGDELGKVFRKHFKGADSSGAGIGLSLVKRICDRYGWEIAIESAVGQGTAVRLVYSASLA
jgi:signal transduction histidine kinase